MQPHLTWIYAQGSGPGGQKINKVMNCVTVVHEPTGLQVRCQLKRTLTENRNIAWKELARKVELHMYGKDSVLGKRVDKAIKRKRKSAARSKAKYGTGNKSESSTTSGDAVDMAAADEAVDTDDDALEGDDVTDVEYSDDEQSLLSGHVGNDDDTDDAVEADVDASANDHEGVTNEGTSERGTAK